MRLLQYQVLPLMTLSGLLVCMPQFAAAQSILDPIPVIVPEGVYQQDPSVVASSEMILISPQPTIQRQHVGGYGSSTNLAPAFQAMIGASPGTYQPPVISYRIQNQNFDQNLIPPMLDSADELATVAEDHAGADVAPPAPDNRRDEVSELRMALDQARESIRVAEQERQMATKAMAEQLELARVQYEELNQRQKAAEDRREEYIGQLREIREQLVEMRSASVRQRGTIKQLKAELAARDLQISELKVKLAKVIPAGKADAKPAGKPARPNRVKTPPKTKPAPKADNAKPAGGDRKPADKPDQTKPEAKAISNEAIEKLKTSMERQIQQATEKSQQQLEQALEALNDQGFGKSHPKSKSLIAGNKRKLDQQIKTIRQRIEARIERLKNESPK